MNTAVEALFPARARRELLRLLWGERRRGSMSELARLAGLSPRAIAVEARSLAAAGLVEIVRVGQSDILEANQKHPVHVELQRLVGAASDRPQPGNDAEVLASLAAHGAPLLVPAIPNPPPLEEALVAGLQEARVNGTVLRVLPVLLLKQEHAIDWPRLKEAARRARVGPVLGMLSQLAGEIARRPGLKARAADLRDRRRTVPVVLPEPRSGYEEQAARLRSPRVARRWGFLLNISEASFRALIEKHA
jgi:DNA-binding transcriptional ArsR family regulator